MEVLQLRSQKKRVHVQAVSFKPAMVGWGTRMLPLCHAIPRHWAFMFTLMSLGGTRADWRLAIIRVTQILQNIISTPREPFKWTAPNKSNRIKMMKLYLKLLHSLVKQQMLFWFLAIIVKEQLFTDFLPWLGDNTDLITKLGELILENLSLNQSAPKEATESSVPNQESADGGSAEGKLILKSSPGSPTMNVNFVLLRLLMLGQHLSRIQKQTSITEHQASFISESQRQY